MPPEIKYIEQRSDRYMYIKCVHAFMYASALSEMIEAQISLATSVDVCCYIIQLDE
jgi:hypothetical protein